MYGNLESKNFPGEKHPDPRHKGRPRLTRQGRGASNAGRVGKGEVEGRERGRREEGQGEGGREGREGKGGGRGKGRGMGGWGIVPGCEN